MEKYSEWKERWQKAFNDWSKENAFFAYSDKQFEQGLKELGVAKEDIYGTDMGMYYKKSASAEMHKIMADQDAEWKELLKNEDFMADAFEYELGNHEFCYTGEFDDTLDALNLTMEDVKKSPILKRALSRATKAYDKGVEDGIY